MDGGIHRLDASDALASLRSTREGLTDAEARARQVEFGPNRLARVGQRPAILQLAAQLTHFFALVLWAAAALALFAERQNPGSGMGALANAIVAVVLINAVFSFWQERRAHRAIAALQRLLPASVRVRRQGRRQALPSADLVPGDILELGEGDHVPADCRLIEAFDVKIDNATLTGESMPQGRVAEVDRAAPDEAPAHQRNMVLAGTSVVAGQALALVVATGMRTEFGRIAHLTQTAPEAIAPLQHEVARLSRVIAALSILLGLGLFGIGRLIGLPFWDNFVFAVGVIVANVPEGLLPTMTLSMAMAAQRMAARRTLVRHLPAVQTLGSATVICTDKTGTLTQNRMRAQRLFVSNEFCEASEIASRPGFAERNRYLFAAASLCHTVQATDDLGGLRGDPMEVALIEMARAALLEAPAGPRIDLVPFNAERRRMATVHADSQGIVVFVKGALEAVLPFCTSIEGPLGSAALTPEHRQVILNAEVELANDGLRVLAFAYRRANGVPSRDHLEEALTFAGLIGLHDPPRPEVPSAIAQCRAAGIKVVMVTGDHPQTGLAIARAIGLVRDRAKVISGYELANLSAAQLRFVLEEPELVFARVSAEQKLRIVQALQQTGAIVAVTGDGVNDAPALKAADIGVAMGVSGTDVAREAADVVLLDDNFASIVAAIEEGRGVFDNIRKFTTYVLTSNVPELVPYLAFVLFRVPLPLTIMQVLAVDLGTDMLPGLGLGADRPEHDVMARPPRTKTDRIIDSRLLARAYLALGTMEAAAAMTAYAFVLAGAGWRWGTALSSSSGLYRQATTACLTAIVIAQVANVFACRSENGAVSWRGFFDNRLILAGVAVELAVIAAIVYTAWGNAIFGTAPIPWTVWCVPVPFALGLIALDSLIKRGFPRAPTRPTSPSVQHATGGSTIQRLL
jgi:calcium-translocating P-type ATPase